MPVIAIGAAVVADVVAGAAVAATVGGIAAISAVTAFEVVAAVGATVGAIGAVTHNKALSMVGTVVGAIGGIGGFAASAGLLGEAAASSAPIFGPAPASTAAADASAPFALGGADAGLRSVAQSESASGSLSSAGDAASADTINFVANGGAPGDVAPPPDDLHLMATETQNASDPALNLAKTIQPSTGSATDTTNSILNGNAGVPTTDTTAATSTATSPTTPGLSGPGTSAAQSSLPVPPQPPGNLGATDPVTGETITTAVDPSGKLVSMPDKASTSIFGKILGFAKDNPAVAMGVIQAGGSFLSGSTSTLTPAQVAALNAQAAANNAAAALANQQRTNLAMPKSVASSAPVTGTPSPLVPQMTTPGIINQAPRQAVTGVPA